MKKYPLKPFNAPCALSYKENLNEQQLNVVTDAQGPCLVLAGAGSGKTRVLIYRLAYLYQQGCDVKNIALLTFTNKAAREMITRAEALLKINLSGLWAGTFHHVANIILHKEARLLGYYPHFTIIDKEDSRDMVDDCIEELGYKKSGKLFPKKNIIAAAGSLAVNSCKNIDEIIAAHYSHIQDYTPQIKRVLHHYALKKKAANVMDFDDLLTNWLAVLKHDDIKTRYASLFRYILVDEYQDTNRLQFKIIKLLASFHHNILVVGDDAQSIYSFRAADINNLLNFPETFKGTRIFKLETNYRSTPQILSMANEIIKHNINQFPKQLKTSKEAGPLPVVIAARDIYEQAQFAAQRLLELNQDDISLAKMAVLFRSRFQALELEVELMKRNIPYVIRGGIRFFEQAHIKDIFAYLKIIANPQDELSFKRAACLHDGIGRGYAAKIWQQTAKENKTHTEILKQLPLRQKKGFEEFSSLLKRLKGITPPEEVIRAIMQAYKKYCHLNFDNPDDRMLDLEELAKMAREFPTVNRFIADLGSYEDFKGETVLSGSQREHVLVLSTIHQAKGLEWDVVFIIGFSDYEFPHPKALASQELLEEERRLFYVAVTRAKRELYIVYPQNKYTFKNGLIVSRASMFFYELPAACYQEWDIQTNTSGTDDYTASTEYIDF